MRTYESEIADKTYLTKGWGYVAALALLPYTVLKSLWDWGATVGLNIKQCNSREELKRK